ncbi:hypothetical protein, partial [Roseisolibacter sp. H3M3-2]|uniref:hypothetical protein n=1 Tax=Roseisolibacter sp. H3M3-2 TaxID=3031323 RepID=UPI0023DABA59
MIARLGPSRAEALRAVRLGGAGIVGAVIGTAAKRADLAETLADAAAAARTLGELPVWESARRLLAALMHVDPAGLLLAAVVLALAAIPRRVCRAP